MAEQQNTNNDKPHFVNGIKTPPGLLLFAYLFAPDSGRQFSDGKYKLTWAVPKDTDISELAAAVKECWEQKYKGICSWEEFKKPFRDGDKKAGKIPGLKGMLYITCKTKDMPIVCDRSSPPKAVGKDDIWPGCKVRLALTCHTYVSTDTVRERKPDGTVEEVTETTYGATFKLEMVQKWVEGDRIGGGRDVSVFDDGYDDGTTPNASVSAEAFDGGGGEEKPADTSLDSLLS